MFLWGKGSKATEHQASSVLVYSRDEQNRCFILMGCVGHGIWTLPFSIREGTENRTHTAARSTREFSNNNITMHPVFLSTCPSIVAEGTRHDNTPCLLEMFFTEIERSVPEGTVETTVTKLTESAPINDFSWFPLHDLFVALFEGNSQDVCLVSKHGHFYEISIFSAIFSILRNPDIRLVLDCLLQGRQLSFNHTSVLVAGGGSRQFSTQRLKQGVMSPLFSSTLQSREIVQAVVSIDNLSMDSAARNSSSKHRSPNGKFLRLGTAADVRVRRIESLSQVNADDFSEGDMFLFDGDKVMFLKRDRQSCLNDDEASKLFLIWPGTPDLIHTLQQKRVKCFGFTSRSYKPEQRAEEALNARLLDIGINFLASFQSGDPREFAIKPQRNSQRFSNGIIHCSSDWDLKGGVLTIFLHQWVAHGGSIPRRIIVVDDKEKHVLSLTKALIDLNMSGVLFQLEVEESTLNTVFLQKYDVDTRSGHCKTHSDVSLVIEERDSDRADCASNMLEAEPDSGFIGDRKLDSSSSSSSSKKPTSMFSQKSSPRKAGNKRHSEKLSADDNSPGRSLIRASSFVSSKDSHSIETPPKLGIKSISPWLRRSFHSSSSSSLSLSADNQPASK